MAIPLILGGLAIVSGLISAGAHFSAKDNREKAQPIYDNSNEKRLYTNQKLENKTEETKKVSENLGDSKKSRFLLFRIRQFLCPLLKYEIAIPEHE